MKNTDFLYSFHHLTFNKPIFLCFYFFLFCSKVIIVKIISYDKPVCRDNFLLKSGLIFIRKNACLHSNQFNST